MQLITLTLNISLHPANIPSFRSCIVETVGREHHIFHNHDNLGGKNHYHWNYPLVQYGVRRGRATVIGIGKGAEAIQCILLPRLPEKSLTFANQSYTLDGFSLKTRNWPVQWMSQPKIYGLTDWLALNKENYTAWKGMTDSEKRKLVLNRALTGQLRALAEGLQLPDHKQAIGEVLAVDNQKRIHWHGTTLVRFNAVIHCNLDLPPGIGLGRAAAFGFGELMNAPFYEQHRRRKSVQKVVLKGIDS